MARGFCAVHFTNLISGLEAQPCQYLSCTYSDMASHPAPDVSARPCRFQCRCKSTWAKQRLPLPVWLKATAALLRPSLQRTVSRALRRQSSERTTREA